MKTFKYFTLEEFTRSTTANHYKIKNDVPDDLLETAEYTLSRLDLIRENYGKPIIITSGYRCPILNKLVGGKQNSQHLRALAADLKWDDDLFNFIKDKCKFDQLIFEKNKYTKWIHISFKKENERHQILNYEIQ